MQSICTCGIKFFFAATDFVRCHKCSSVVHNGDGKEPERTDPWGMLHSYAPTNASKWNPATARQWYQDTWNPLIPSCGECRQHWAELTKQHPPDFSSARAFFEWAWARHNDVSTMHSKRPTITLEEAYTVYWS